MMMLIVFLINLIKLLNPLIKANGNPFALTIKIKNNIYQKEVNMNKKELKKIKEKALEDNIPIIMDDTLEVIKKYLENKDPKARKILEIGTAVRIFCYLFFRIFRKRSEQ